MLDLSKPFAVIAADMDKATFDAFDQGRSQSGAPFAALSRRTILARIAKQKGANRRTKKTGKLTRGAKEKRQGYRALLSLGGAGYLQSAGVAKPLLDTLVARNGTAHIPGPDGIRIRVVRYLLPHITGVPSKHLPKRDPLVFEKAGDGIKLLPQWDARVRKDLIAHVNGGAR